MDFRGLTKFTLVDYPGKIGCIVFSGGCNLRCPFCHNPCLVFDPASQPRVTEKELFGFLEKRRGLLEGVVLSGGEPLLHSDAPDIVERIRAMGYKVKVDTNGTLPEKLRQLLDTAGVDALGIDYKTTGAKYRELTGSGDPDVAEKVCRSIRMAVETGVELDVRTTVHRALLSEAMLQKMHEELQELGVENWTLQQFHPVEVIDDDLPEEETYSDGELVRIARSLGSGTRVRGVSGRILG